MNDMDNNTDVIKQKSFHYNWEGNPEKTSASPDGYYPMRGWQSRAFELLKTNPFMIINAPMGSGKSWLICLLSAFKLRSNPTLRCIITVPQTIIASGFTEAKFEMPDGERLDWKVIHNLCERGPKNGTVNQFIGWLANPSTIFNERVILCTHATLVAAYRKLQSIGRLDLLNNLLMWIDEAHHIKNLANETLEGIVISNGLGELVNFFLNKPSEPLQIGLTTASFFRGDRCTLLTPTMEEKFVRFNLPYDEYLQSMTYLQSFNFDFLICGHDFIKPIQLLLQNQQSKDIIYIPHPVSQHSTGNKYQEVEKIIDVFANLNDGTIHQSLNDLTLIRKKDGSFFKILNLVNEYNRKEKKEFLNDPILKKDRNSLDVIITLGMFKEGANWIWAERVIIIGARSSLVDIIQIMGRVFRDAPGKKHVEIIQLLPFSLEQQDDEKFRNNLNNYLKAIYASLILENIFNPVKIKAPISEKDKIETHLEERNKKQDWLNVLVPDEGQRASLIEEVGNQLINILDEEKYNSTNANLWNEYQKIIPTILDEYGIETYKEEIAKQIWGIFARQTLRVQGLSVDDIEFDILQKTHPLDFLLRYTSGLCNITTFKQLREAIQASRVFIPFEDARRFVRDLGLRSETEWRKYIAGEMPNLPPLPNNIPRAPWVAYENKGWLSWGDFLGTHQTAPRLRRYRSYEGAAEFARQFNFKNREAWASYCKGEMTHLPSLPDDIPAAPDKTYRRAEYGNKWNGWGEFLGTNRVSNQDKAKHWMSYDEALKFVKQLNLKTNYQWRLYIAGELTNLPKMPENLPRKPHEVYSEWTNWPTFLGNKIISKFNVHRSFWSFEKARSYVRLLGLKKQKDWHDYCAGKLTHLDPKPIEIPSNPAKKYETYGWINLKDWLGLQ